MGRGSKCKQSKRPRSDENTHIGIHDLPSNSSFTSRAAFSPSSRRFLSIIFDLSEAALSSALTVHPMIEPCAPQTRTYQTTRMIVTLASVGPAPAQNHRTIKTANGCDTNAQKSRFKRFELKSRACDSPSIACHSSPS